MLAIKFDPDSPYGELVVDDSGAFFLDSDPATFTWTGTFAEVAALRARQRNRCSSRCALMQITWVLLVWSRRLTRSSLPQAAFPRPRVRTCG